MMMTPFKRYNISLKYKVINDFLHDKCLISSYENENNLRQWPMTKIFRPHIQNKRN